jgi:hypothetical protein
MTGRKLETIEPAAGGFPAQPSENRLNPQTLPWLFEVETLKRRFQLILADIHHLAFDVNAVIQANQGHVARQVIAAG